MLFAFLSALIEGLSIQTAYEQAKGTPYPRQAYRWLNKLTQQLSRFRRGLSLPEPADSQRCRRLRLLLPSLQTLFGQQKTRDDEGVAAYQQHPQIPFA